MSINCEWIPKIIELRDFGGDWYEYDSYLYSIFVRDFIDNPMEFNGKPLRIRRHPMQGDKEQAYFHVTNKDSSLSSNDPNDRVPDLRRCERIEWIRLFLENYDCNKGCKDCSGIKVWRENYKGNDRLHFLFEEYRFLVIIEERKDYYLLISGFYIFNDRIMANKLKKYNKFKKKA